MFSASVLRFYSVARKEFIHILRDPMTLFFTLFIPICEMFMLGYAIDTNVRFVRTAVLDLAHTQESQRLLRQFENSKDFLVTMHVQSDEELQEAIVAGKARIGIKIPEDYSRRLVGGQTAQILVLVDGSESSIAAEAVNVGNAIALRESLQTILQDRPLPVEARPPLGEFLHSRIARGDVPDDGCHAFSHFDCPRERKRHARTALHDSSAS